VSRGGAGGGGGSFGAHPNRPPRKTRCASRARSSPHLRPWAPRSRPSPLSARGGARRPPPARPLTPSAPPSRRSFSLTFSTAAGDLGDLNVFLQSRSYVVGFTPSAVDAALFKALGAEPSAAKFPNVARFYKHLASFSAEARAAFPAAIGGAAAGGAAPKGAAKAAPKDDEEEVDLFGDDDNAAPAVAAEKPKVEAKKVKEKPIARSICVYEVKPMSATQDEKVMDATIAKMEAALRSIQQDGLKWSETFEVVKVGFGVKKLMVQMVIEGEGPGGRAGGRGGRGKGREQGGRAAAATRLNGGGDGFSDGDAC